MRAVLLDRTLTVLCILGLGLSAGCSDSSDRDPDIPTPEIPVSLEATGVYDGTLETDAGDLALMRLVLARDGDTAITLQSDDSGRADRVLWGSSNGDSSTLDFNGDDSANGATISLDLAVADTVISGQLSLSDIAGEFRLTRHPDNDTGGGLAAIAGDYGRTTPAGELLRLQLAEDGSVTVSGACEGSGSVSSPDEQVNVYRLSSDASCLDIEVLLSAADLVSEDDVLSLSGLDGDGAYVADFYRLVAN